MLGAGPMSAVEIGPLVFSIERFAALLGVAVFIAVAEVLARATRQRSLGTWASSAAVWGLVGARLGHVALYWSSFAEDPLRIFAIWQGGDFPPSGRPLPWPFSPGAPF